MAAYIALIRKDEGTCFGVDFPDFPGCITGGDTLEEARKAAIEVLRFHAAGMVEDGEALPAPSTLDQVMADPHNRDAVAFLVDLPIEQRARAVRLAITMDERVLAIADAQAAEMGLSRSGYLAELVRHHAAKIPLATLKESSTDLTAGTGIVSHGHTREYGVRTMQVGRDTATGAFVSAKSARSKDEKPVVHRVPKPGHGDTKSGKQYRRTIRSLTSKSK